MQRERWVAARQERWRRLDEMVSRAGHGRLERLSGEDLLELGDLYRAATSDLATARRDLPGDRVTDYLNALIARAHPVVYREPAMDAGRIGAFIRYGFPAAYRRAWPYIALAFAITAVSALIAALLVARSQSLADILLPGQAQPLRDVLQQHHLWFKSATENHSVAESEITINNIKVAFFAFAGGMLVGVGSFFVLAYNGVSIGAVAALVAHYGLSLGFWSFVVPHGVVELSVIFIAGGAGMMIGDSILRPGLQPRSRALVTASRHAAHLLFGCVPLLIFAGATESFLSPSDAPAAVKFIFGAVSGVLLYSYLIFSRPMVKVARYRFDEIAPDASLPTFPSRSG